MGFFAWIVVGLIAGWLAGQASWAAFWEARDLARRRDDSVDHRGICWRGDFGLDYALTEKSLKTILEE